jgi:hypothetical protein
MRMGAADYINSPASPSAGGAGTEEADFAFSNLAFSCFATSQLHKTRDVYKTTLRQNRQQ